MVERLGLGRQRGAPVVRVRSRLHRCPKTSALTSRALTRTPAKWAVQLSCAKSILSCMHFTPSAPGGFKRETPPQPTGRALHANIGRSGRHAQLLGLLAGAKPLGVVVERIEPYAGRLTADPGIRGFFRGDATGIPLHSILVDGPLDAWWSVIFLDFHKEWLPARRKAAGGPGRRGSSSHGSLRLGAVVDEGSSHQARRHRPRRH